MHFYEDKLFLKTLLILMAMFQSQCCLLSKVLGTERVNFRSSKLSSKPFQLALAVNVLHCTNWVRTLSERSWKKTAFVVYGVAALPAPKVQRTAELLFSACCVLSYNGNSLEVQFTHPPPDICIQLVMSLQTEKQQCEDKGSDSVSETHLLVA